MESVVLQALYGWRCPVCGVLNAVESIHGDRGVDVPPMAGAEYECRACGHPVKLGDVSVADNEN